MVLNTCYCLKNTNTWKGHASLFHIHMFFEEVEEARNKNFNVFQKNFES